MGALRAATFRIAAVSTVTLLPLDADAQERSGATETKRKDSVTTAVAGQHYATDGWKRTILGAGWRDVWVTPVSAPSLDVSTYAGGLEVLERGGAIRASPCTSGRIGVEEYRFRSVNKFPGMTLPGALHETAAGRLIRIR
jgi:hypothetical protein